MLKLDIKFLLGMLKILQFLTDLKYKSFVEDWIQRLSVNFRLEFFLFIRQ